MRIIENIFNKKFIPFPKILLNVIIEHSKQVKEKNSAYKFFMEDKDNEYLLEPIYQLSKLYKIARMTQEDGLMELLGEKEAKDYLSGVKFKEKSFLARGYKQEDYEERNQELIKLKNIVTKGMPPNAPYNKTKICKKVMAIAEKSGIKCPQDRQLHRIIFK